MLSGYSQPQGLSSDPLTPHQPIRNNFGGEIYLRYALPQVGGVAVDFTASLANGDPTIAYQGLLHDAVARFNIAYYPFAETYFALNVKY